MRYWRRHSNWGSNCVKDCSLLVLVWTNTAPRWIWGDYVSSTIADLPEGAGNHFIQLNQLQCCNLLLCSGVGAGYWVQVNHSRIRSKKLFSMSPLAMIPLFLKVKTPELKVNESCREPLSYLLLLVKGSTGGGPELTWTYFFRNETFSCPSS